MGNDINKMLKMNAHNKADPDIEYSQSSHTRQIVSLRNISKSPL